MGKKLLRAKSVSEEGFYKTAFNLTVLVAGLGYFIDTFDFFLYNSMRVPSLIDLGLSGDALTRTGIIILNCQIFGALIGSFFWGVLGDKVGRKSSLFASILIYSVGMVVNGFIQDPVSYGFVRFVIGFGVAGEVGLGATLVAETIQSSKRTYSLMFFTVLGVLGVVIAGMCIEYLSWRTSCFVGGVLGLLLLFLRSVLFESPVFIETAGTNVRRGSLRDLLFRSKNLKKFLLCVPILGANFFITGLLMTLAPEIANATGTRGVIKANIALALYFFVSAFGDGFGAWLSELFKSRRLVAGSFLLGSMSLAFFLLLQSRLSVLQFYALCAAFGLFNLWAISGTIVVEQFPTELRATASTSNFNLSRATVILMNFTLLTFKPIIGMSRGLIIIGFIVFSLGLVCVWRLRESYGCSLTESEDGPIRSG